MRPASRSRAALGLAAICLLVVITGRISAKTHYIDQPGGIAAVNSLDLAPGDSVLFKGGQTFSGNLVLTGEDAGTAASPVVLGSYGTGKATLNAGNGNGIYWENCGGVVVRDLVITGSGVSTNLGSGVCIVNKASGNNKKDHVRVINVSASGFGSPRLDRRGCGIWVGGLAADGSKSGFNDVLIEGCTTHDNTFSGITVTGYWQDNPTRYANTNVTVRHCVSYNNKGNAEFTSNWSGNGIFVEDSKGVLIERCEAYGNGDNCPPAAPGGPVGIWTAISRDVVIQYCESHHNSSGGKDGGGFDFDGGVINGTIQYCYSHNNKGAGYLIYIYNYSPWYNDNLTVRYCISENDGSNTYYAGISLLKHGDTQKNIRIYNNTLYQGSNSARKCIDLQGTTGIENISVHNNLFVSAGARLVSLKGDAGRIRLEGNAYFSSGSFSIYDDGANYTSLAAWRTATGQEKRSGAATGVQADPLLTGAGGGITVGDPRNLEKLTAYRLKAGSPLIDAGLNLSGLEPGTLPQTDFFGTAVPQNGVYDIGVFEYGGTPAVITPTITPGTGTYYGPVKVTLACATSGATIRYTTNGTEPVSSSAVYSGTITISATGTIKAKAFKSGMNASAVAGATYTIKDAGSLHIKINAGPGSVSGWENDDAYVSGGNDYTFTVTSLDVSKAADPGPAAMYQTVRHLEPVFTFPQVPDGSYTVRLHYTDGDDTNGGRKMVIRIEDQTVESAFNIRSAAGAAWTAVVKDYNVTVNDGNGLKIEFGKGTGNDAFVSGIEIIAGTQTSIYDFRFSIFDLKTNEYAFPAAVYDLQGRRVDLRDAQAGVYIVRGRGSGQALAKHILVAP